MADDSERADPWDAHGADYDRAFGPSFTAIAEDALRFADVRPGVRLLDVAAGSGALSIPAAALGADVFATDQSSGMLELLRSRAAAAGVEGIQTRVMDGTALDLEDESFDRVCSQFGVMLFPDPDAGLREMRRVTVAGGSGVMVIFGRPERVVPLQLFGEAIGAALPDIELPAGSPLQEDPASLRDAMGRAGYEDVHIEVLDQAIHVGSPEGAWDVMSTSAPGIAMFLQELPADRVRAIREGLIGSAVERYGADLTELPVEVMVGVGRRR